jgi:hypothetical protein
VARRACCQPARCRARASLRGPCCGCGCGCGCALCGRATRRLRWKRTADQRGMRCRARVTVSAC